MSTLPVYQTKVDSLPVNVYKNDEEMGRAAAAAAATVIQKAIAQKGAANIIIATGNSQRSFLSALVMEKDIDWSKVSVFHMDEYVDLPPGHTASFPKFLQKHLLDHVKAAAFYPVKAKTGELESDCADYAKLLRAHPADLCAMGIGENGHIAFNDPPFAEFKDPEWVKVIRLAQASRQQQVGEGHFKNIDEVPTHAVTLTIPALLAANSVLCIVPESRKADAVLSTLTGPVTEDCPASILRTTPHAGLYLDADAAAKYRAKAAGS